MKKEYIKPELTSYDNLKKITAANNGTSGPIPPVT